MLPGVEPCAAPLVDSVDGIVAGSRAPLADGVASIVAGSMAPLVNGVASRTVVGSGSGLLRSWMTTFLTSGEQFSRV